MAQIWFYGFKEHLNILDFVKKITCLINVLSGFNNLLNNRGGGRIGELEGGERTPITDND